jgi:uncharacterized delta-60 repeat protein
LALVVLPLTSIAAGAPGGLDSGFGAGGKVLTDLGGVEWSGAVALGPRGTIVVAGGSGNDAAVARYDRAGRPDATFGDNGVVTSDFGSDDAADAVVVLGDGRVVTAGHADGDLVLARYTPTGRPDASFDGDGSLVRDFGGEQRISSLVRGASGRVIVAVHATHRLILAAYTASGRPDARFGQRGTVVRRTPGIEWREAVAGPGGTIVVSGARVVTGHAQGYKLAVARYRADGRPDRTFGGDGLVVMATRPHWAGAIKPRVRPDGRVLLGMHGHLSPAAGGGFAVIQLRRNGSLDRTFGTGGVAFAPVGFGVHAMDVDSRGRIVAVGRTQDLRDWVVARFTAKGRRDRSFAATVADFGGVDTPFAAELQPDGKFVVAGASSPSGGLLGDIAVARFLTR